MRYEILPEYTWDEIERIIAMENEELIKILPMSVGDYCDDLKLAQDICIRLLEHRYSEESCANAVLGLSYLARRFEKLDKKVVPYLKKELVANETFGERVLYAVEDIQLFTKGRIRIRAK